LISLGSELRTLKGGEPPGGFSPRLWWGATDEEVGGPYPGADLVPGGERAATMAVTIEVPADQVWPKSRSATA
jgi:hypothetical protein